MFRWHKEIERLDIPASQVLHLERSLSAVQVALPGLPSQEATAYLCVFAVGKGLRVALVLHLHTSQCLAFYLHERAEAPLQEAARLIEEGALFAESMGFMLSDMDYRILGVKKRDALWDSLPLKAGVEPQVPVAAAAAFLATEEPSAAVGPPPPANLAGVEPPVPADEAVVDLAEEAPSTPSAPVEVMPDALSGSGTTMRVGARKWPPGAEELTARRQKLLESLGRFLASL
jgi:hypothetical protein